MSISNGRSTSKAKVKRCVGRMKYYLVTIGRHLRFRISDSYDKDYNIYRSSRTPHLGILLSQGTGVRPHQHHGWLGVWLPNRPPIFEPVFVHLGVVTHDCIFKVKFNCFIYGF